MEYSLSQQVPTHLRYEPRFSVPTRTRSCTQYLTLTILFGFRNDAIISGVKEHSQSRRLGFRALSKLHSQSLGSLRERAKPYIGPVTTDSQAKLTEFSPLGLIELFSNRSGISKWMEQTMFYRVPVTDCRAARPRIMSIFLLGHLCANEKVCSLLIVGSKKLMILKIPKNPRLPAGLQISSEHFRISMEPILAKSSFSIDKRVRWLFIVECRGPFMLVIPLENLYVMLTMECDQAYWSTKESSST
jgi:hypothetical protein